MECFQKKIESIDVENKVSRHNTCYGRGEAFKSDLSEKNREKEEKF